MENLRHMTFDDGSRRSGNTYRMMLLVLHRATANPRESIAVIVSNKESVMNVLQMAKSMTMPLYEMARISYSQQCIDIGSSRIDVVVAGDDMIRHSQGKRLTDWAVDASVKRLDPVVAEFLESVIRPN